MEVDNVEEQAGSSKSSRACCSSPSSSGAADEEGDPSLWLDMIQELFDLPPPSPSAVPHAPATSPLNLGGADKIAADHSGFRLQDQLLFSPQAHLPQQLYLEEQESTNFRVQEPVSSSSFSGAAALKAPLTVNADLDRNVSSHLGSAAEMELELQTHACNRSFSCANLWSTNQQHSSAYSYPPTGYSRSSGGFSGLVKAAGGGAAIQKVCSAPQLIYPPSSSTFSWPSLGENSSALRQQPLTRYHSMLPFSPSSMHNPRALITASFGQQHLHNQPPEMTSVQRRKQEVERGLGLVHMLLACAEAVAKEDLEAATALLIQLHPLVSKTGSSMQRVAAYFAEALHARLTHTGGGSYAVLINPNPLEDVMEAYQVLYQACPYIKFAHFTSNQAIFEAFEGEGQVHIVDLDIMQGYQWPAFIQALAARHGGAPHLRITGVGTPLEAVQDIGKQLGELAEALHVSFEFHAIGERLEDLNAHMLQRREGEALAINAINCLHPLLSLPPSNKSLPNLLYMLLNQAPNIFILVEKEASHNGPFFLSRFLEALHFYSAIFDSLDATLPQHSQDRAKVEMFIFAQEIVNIVACEDDERVKRHEKLDKWRHIMMTIGFQSIAFSANANNQSRVLLDLYPRNGYMLKERKGALQLGWQDRAIIVASAWH
ncbi:hypothetical protein L7F22_052596 [Adiantum nelumboides]|nr:hypothetical protein [Adiantum nelumboides]